MSSTSPWRARLWSVGRFLIAASLIGWLLWNAGTDEILTAVRESEPMAVVGGFFAVLALSICKIWNWKQLLSALDAAGRKSSRRLFMCYFSGGLLGTVVPSTAGTDALRAMLARREFGGEVSRNVAAIVVLNALSLLASCSLGLVAIAVLTVEGGWPVIGYVAAPLFLMVTVGFTGVYALLKFRRSWWLWILSLTPRPLFKVRRPFRKFADQLLVFERAHAPFMSSFVVALAAQSFYALAIALCGAAVGVELPWAYWFVYGPLAAAAAIIPASVSGFGGDQVALVYIMGLAGVAAAQAFVVSILLAVINLVMNVVVGGLTFMIGSVWRDGDQKQLDVQALR